MASCNVEIKACKDEKKIKSSSEIYGPLSKNSSIGCDSTDASILMRNASMDRGMSIDPPINNNLGSDVTELQCSFKSNCSQTKKRRKNKKRLQIEQNSRIDFQREGSSIKDDSVGINSHNECRVDINTKTDLQTIEKLSRSHKKRMRKKQKRNETVISTEAHVPSAECHLLKVGGEC